MAYKSPYGTELKFSNPIDVKAHNASVTKASEKFVKKNPQAKRKSLTREDFEREMSGGDSFRDVNKNTAKSHALNK